MPLLAEVDSVEEEDTHTHSLAAPAAQREGKTLLHCTSVPVALTYVFKLFVRRKTSYFSIISACARCHHV